MAVLLLAAALWLLVHIGFSGTALRGRFVHWLGERAFSGVFSALAAASLLLLIVAYNHAATAALWVTPHWLVWLMDVGMLFACILFVAAVTPANPTMTGGERAPAREPRGIFRITRHPMLNAFGIWSAVHLIANGDSASLLFFGAFLLTVAFGMPSIDAKLARRDPEKWAMLSRSTSALPFLAILTGRNRYDAKEIGWQVPLVGTVLWLVLIALHPLVIGVRVLPT